jgi:hypothetical protein
VVEEATSTPDPYPAAAATGGREDGRGPETGPQVLQPNSPGSGEVVAGPFPDSSCPVAVARARAAVSKRDWFLRMVKMHLGILLFTWQFIAGRRSRRRNVRPAASPQGGSGSQKPKEGRKGRRYELLQAFLLICFVAFIFTYLLNRLLFILISR